MSGIIAVQQGVQMIAEEGIDPIREKSEIMTTFTIDLLDELGLEVTSPRDSRLRGSHVTVRHPEARSITDQLIEQGVVPDFREPDLIRLGLSPLTTSYAEVAEAVRILGETAPPIG
ncbi:hypothetical protein [Aeromicrobium sp. UC242_57]|uniref:kynureninase/PvdN C-terminal domain-containing protein n=1 Tax=Aeromicrobium sp. UC242_57 TaxID=3374624 RepID=UPI0037C10482